MVMSDVSLDASSEVFRSPYVQWVLCSSRVRSVPQGWRAGYVVVDHGSVEGVTDGKEKVTLLGREGAWDKSRAVAEPLWMGSTPTRDLMSVADDLLPGAPTERRKENERGRLIKVQRLTAGTYFGSGLMPRHCARKTKFVLPSVRSKTKWVTRPLSLKERWLALDAPYQVADGLSDGALSRALSGVKLGNCLREGARWLLETQGIQGAPGAAENPRVWGLNSAVTYTGEADLGGNETSVDEREIVDCVPVRLGLDDPLPVFGVKDLPRQERLPKRPRANEKAEAGGPKGQRILVETVEKEVEVSDAGESEAGAVTDMFQKGESLANIRREPEESCRGEGNGSVDEGSTCPNGETTTEIWTDGPPVKKQDSKATIADDARVKVEMWNGYLSSATGWDTSTDKVKNALDVIRDFGLRWWKRKLTGGFARWSTTRQPKWRQKGNGLRSSLVAGKSGAHGRTYHWDKEGLASYRKWWRWRHRAQRRNREAGLDAISRAANSSWFGWDDGSAPFFWRWPKEYQRTMRDGLKVWLRDEGPRNKRGQRPERDAAVKAKMKEKLMKVRDRRYICPGKVDSLTNYFSVPKGEFDVRMVYDGTASGLNILIWVPRFPLPTAETHLRGLEPGTFMGDVDLGECFLNFILHESIQSLCGVDFTDMFKEELDGEARTQLWERWVRCAMGLKSSPYQVCQAILFAEEVIRGDRKDKDNPFKWDKVRVNLPGSPGYDPTKPWVSKIRVSDGKIAADFYVYVDDARITGATDLECWVATRRVAAGFNHLGIQDAPRKRRPPSVTPGAWAGSVLTADQKMVGVRVSQEKWDKAKGHLRDTLAEVEGGGGHDLKTLLRRRGFLQYVTRTYPCTIPHLRGFHNTIDAWRPNRDSDTGWYVDRYGPKRRRVVPQVVEKEEVEKLEGLSGDDLEFALDEIFEGAPPERVPSVHRLGRDLRDLLNLFEAETPPVRVVRADSKCEVVYGFGDASATGFASTWSEEEGTSFVYGQWCSEVVEKSSNFRELTNLVKTIKKRVKEGKLGNCELFVFTDNTTAEAAFWNGNSTSEALLDAIVELRKLEMDAGMIVHLVHVSGKRMIHQGTDGLSRADTQTGCMVGKSMLDYVPLHKRPDERQESLVPWVKKWWAPKKCGELQVHYDAEDWYTTCHQDGAHLWLVPPAAGDVVAEELGRAIHKRPTNYHIVLIPRLMKNRWYRKLCRESTFVFEIPIGTEGVWEASQLEPLVMFVSLPLCRYAPWTLKRTPFVENMCGLLRSVWEGPDMGRRHILRKFFVSQAGLDSLPESVVQQLLREPNWKPLPNQAFEGRG